MERESMVFYRSFFEAIEELDAEEFKNAVTAIMEYALNGKEIESNGAAKVFFKMAKPQIDANNQRYENGKKGAEYGKKGAKHRPDTPSEPQANPSETPSEPQANPNETPSEPQANPSETPNVNENVNENVNDNVNVNDKTKISYQLYADMFNAICVSLPRVESLSDKRKQAIRARLKRYTTDQFKTVFEKAEASDFLRGANNRNWLATFDWLISDSNFAKVLDGNYDNKDKLSNRIYTDPEAI